MRKRLLALLLCVVTVLGLFAAPASAASSEEEALGEIDIYSGGTMSALRTWRRAATICES